MLRATHRRRPFGMGFSRQLRLEYLENRRLLAVFTVSNPSDSGAGSLREAIGLANGKAGTDTIEFDANVFTTPQTIAMTQGEMVISEAVMIDGPGQGLLTIDAQRQSRIFNISATAGDFAVAGITLTGGRTTGDNANIMDTTFSGGAVRSLTSGNLTFDQSTINGNSTEGEYARGGGIFSSGTVTVINSTIIGNNTVERHASGGGMFSDGAVTFVDSALSGNSTLEFGAFGGGLRSQGSVTLMRSTVSDNSTGGGGVGGGIYSNSQVTITQSTISGNSTAGFGARGGGVFSFGFLSLTSTTVSGNSTTGDGAQGGGVSSFAGVELINSTLSGNSTAGSEAHGGGIRSGGTITIASSTVTNNHANSSDAAGGGIWNDNDTVTIINSIVAGNSGGGGMNDMEPGTGAQNVNFSLIGDTSGLTIAGVGNATNIDPQLEPLADNGGLTQSHALLAGSPAIDAGDPTILFNADDFDQRGAPFVRVADGGVAGQRIDMGSYELQGTFVDGDFNDDGLYDCMDMDALVAAIAAGNDDIAFDLTADGTVNLSDRDAWLAEAGNANLGPGKVYLLGDANLDGFVDGLDYIDWNTNKFTSNAAWCSGDFNADSFVDGLDYIIWNSNKFQSSDGRAAVLPQAAAVTSGTTRSDGMVSDRTVLESNAKPPLVAQSQPKELKPDGSQQLAGPSCFDTPYRRACRGFATRMHLDAFDFVSAEASWLQASWRSRVSDAKAALRQ